MQQILTYIFLIIYSVTILGIILVVITDNRNPLKTLPWIIVLVLAPVLGLIFYFFFGQNLSKQRIISRRTRKRITLQLEEAEHTDGPDLPEAYRPLAALLTNLQEGDVLFIDEIHRLSRQVEEVLYPALEDYALDIMIGKGPSAQSIRINLPRFTLVGATTRAGQITGPLRDRFGVTLRLELYTPEELATIVTRSAGILNVEIEPEGAMEIARRSRGTPRIANRMLRRVRDFAQVVADGVITRKVADQALLALEVDFLGLDQVDRRMLRAIIENYGGGPVGLETLAATIGEESVTLEDVYEPYLMQIGFLTRTPRGRCVTRKAYEHLHIDRPEPEQLSL